MIPELNQSGVLPPFIAERGPTDSGSMAPYQASIVEFVAKYNTSAERRKVLRGLLKYREKLREIGISDGFQWLDGSFVEDCELNRGRAPNDVDVVTFAARPTQFVAQEGWEKFVGQNIDLFQPHALKEIYQCDAYFVDLSNPPAHLVNQTRYWFGLFSHQKESYLWKGMVEIPLTSDDDVALAMLEQEHGDA